MLGRIMAIAAALALSLAVAGCAPGGGAGGLFTTNEWPAAAVDGFPEPDTRGGRIVEVEENTYGAVVVYEGLGEDEVLQYVQDVKDYGFDTSQSETRGESSYHYRASTRDRGWSNVSIDCAKESFGRTRTVITISLDRSTR